MAAQTYDDAIAALGQDGWPGTTTLATLYRQKGEILDATLIQDYGEVGRGLRVLYDSAPRGGPESRRVVISHELWAARFRCRNCRETPKTLVWCNNASHGHAYCYDCAVTLTEGTAGTAVVCDHCQDRQGVIGPSGDGFRFLDATDHRLMRSAVLECLYCDALVPALRYDGHACSAALLPTLPDGEAGISSGLDSLRGARSGRTIGSWAGQDMDTTSTPATQLNLFNPSADPFEGAATPTARDEHIAALERQLQDERRNREALELELRREKARYLRQTNQLHRTADTVRVIEEEQKRAVNRVTGALLEYNTRLTRGEVTATHIPVVMNPTGPSPGPRGNETLVTYWANSPDGVRMAPDTHLGRKAPGACLVPSVRIGLRQKYTRADGYLLAANYRLIDLADAYKMDLAELATINGWHYSVVPPEVVAEWRLGGKQPFLQAFVTGPAKPPDQGPVMAHLEEAPRLNLTELAALRSPTPDPEEALDTSPGQRSNNGPTSGEPSPGVEGTRPMED